MKMKALAGLTTPGPAARAETDNDLTTIHVCQDVNSDNTAFGAPSTPCLQ
jgi:hypothetical protein